MLKRSGSAGAAEVVPAWAVAGSAAAELSEAAALAVKECSFLVEA
jgi:hypothetical protein